MIFVTGGTGLLGNCIVRELCSRQIPTRVLCRQSASRIPFEGLDVQIVEGDLNSREVLNSAISGCKAVIHSAAMIHIGWHKLAESRQVNVEGTRNIVASCLQSGSRMIHISTVDTLPAATSLDRPIDERAIGGVSKTACSYVISKCEAEALVRDAVRMSGLDAVILNPGFMLGPYDWKPSSGRMFLQVAKAPIVAAPSGGCSLCDARQVAAACVNAVELGRKGENYILAGENMSYRDLWSRMLEVAGRRKRVFRLGPAAKLFGRAIDLVHCWLPIAEGDVNGAAIAMGNLMHYYDSGKAQRELGFCPSVTNHTLSEIWTWLNSNRGTNEPKQDHPFAGILFSKANQEPWISTKGG